MSSLLIREDLIPMVVGYLLVMGALATGMRILRRSGPAVTGGGRRAAKPGAAGETAPLSWPRLVRHLLTTEIGGYVVLMVVIVGYYFGVHSVHALVQSAISGCGLLLGLSTPVFLALSWLDERRHRRRRPLKPAEASQD
jgi:Family of unknown function (DUF6256)